MIDYVSMEEARKARGLRLVLGPGRPGGWGESAKSICYVKGLDYVATAQEMNSDNLELLAWTAQTAAPVAVYEDEAPRTSWIEQVYLFERLAPEPQLIPSDSETRVRMFGMAAELCAQDGFGWCRRLMMLHETLADPEAPERDKGFAGRMGAKYGYSAAAAEAAPGRCADILRTFSRQIEAQHKRGVPYLLGDSLTALDIYWASFAALVKPLPEEVCPMQPWFREKYTNKHPLLAEALSPLLLEHRDFMYDRWLKLPVEL